MPSPTPLTTAVTSEVMDMHEHVRKAKSLAAAAQALWEQAEGELVLALASGERSLTIAQQADEARRDAIYRLNQGTGSAWRERQSKGAAALAATA